MLVALVALIAGCGGGGSSSGDSSSGGSNNSNATLIIDFRYALQPTSPGYMVWQPISVAPTLNGLQGNTPTCSLFSGQLPPGLTLNSTTCVIAGTPTKAGQYIPIVRLTVAGYESYIDEILAITIDPPKLSYTLPPNTANLKWGEYVSLAPTHLGYVPAATDTVRYAVQFDSLIPGLGINTATGVISGTPTAVNLVAVRSLSIAASITHAGNTNVALSVPITLNTVAPYAVAYDPFNGKVGTAFSLAPKFINGIPDAQDRHSFDYGASTGYCAGLRGFNLNGATGILSGTPVDSLSGCNITIRWIATRNGASFSGTTQPIPITVLP